MRLRRPIPEPRLRRRRRPKASRRRPIRRSPSAWLLWRRWRNRSPTGSRCSIAAPTKPHPPCSKLRARAEAAVRAGAEQGATARQQPPAIGKAEFDALAERVASLQRTAASLQQSVEQTTTSLQQTLARGTETTAAGDRAVRFALVASGLRSAVERGAPYSGEFKAATALAPDAQLLAPLEPFAATGVPTAEALGRELAALAPQLAGTGNAAVAPDTGYLERLQAHAERLVRVRPVSAVAGDDVTAVVARIEVKAKQADLAAALTELRKLPESARAPAAAWMKKAEGREAAVAAAQRTENAALAALANP